MYIVHVYVHLKKDQVNAFLSATSENAMNSLKNEPGVVRFDVLQEVDNPTHFVLTEVYRTLEDSVKHKETDHYKKWRELAEPMMSEPRSRNFYKNIFPSDLAY
jgi:(4S)-4-hydroxy-5-phosphonooxypentane-2,3-dione isomerase